MHAVTETSQEEETSLMSQVLVLSLERTLEIQPDYD
jgi:hypothetical protein